MAEDAVQDLEGKVQTFTLLFHPFQEPDPLDAVEEGPDAVGLAEPGEDALAVVAEGRVPDVVPQGDGFEQVLVEAQVAANGPGNLGEKLNVEDPVADMLMLNEIKDLGFVNIAGIGLGMEDTVGIYRKILAMPLLDALLKATSDGLGAPGRIGGQASFFLPVELLA